MYFLELLIYFLEKLNLERKKEQKEFKKKINRELNEWHTPNKIKINLSDKYR